MHERYFKFAGNMFFVQIYRTRSRQLSVRWRDGANFPGWQTHQPASQPACARRCIFSRSGCALFALFICRIIIYSVPGLGWVKKKKISSTPLPQIQRQGKTFERSALKAGGEEKRICNCFPLCSPFVPLAPHLLAWSFLLTFSRRFICARSSVR